MSYADRYAERIKRKRSPHDEENTESEVKHKIIVTTIGSSPTMVSKSKVIDAGL